MPLYEYRGKRPRVARDAFIAPTAVLVGDVTVAAGASVWFGTVLRGDMDRIEIGERSNVQDNSTIHTDEGEPTLIAGDVTIGHMALVHSAIVDSNVLIGPAAVLVDGGAGAMWAPEGGPHRLRARLQRGRDREHRIDCRPRGASAGPTDYSGRATESMIRSSCSSAN